MSKMGLRRLICGSGAAGRVRDYSSSSANGAVVSPTPRVIVPVIDMRYKLRSLAADSFFDVNKNKGSLGDDAEAELVGSSQGWVALFNKSKDELFLSTPLSDRRRISLPPVRTLPEPDLNLDLDGNASVSKVIISSSPDDEDCCAMMIFGAANRLAFCFLNRSSEWTPIGRLFRDDRALYPFVKFVHLHEDLVYCSRRKAFTSISPCEIINWENWERFSLRDVRVVTQRSYADCTRTYPSFGPTLSHFSIERPLYKTRLQLRAGDIFELGMEQGGVSQIWVKENKEFLGKYCIQIPHLVYAEHSDQLFLVLRFVRPIHNYSRDYIPYCEVKGLKEVCECQTFGFLVMEVDRKGCCRVVDDLDGMAMFVGINNSFALPAAANDRLKANSIYFTDAKRSRMMCGVNDNGIFDYQTKEISHIDICGGIFSENDYPPIEVYTDSILAFHVVSDWNSGSNALSDDWYEAIVAVKRSIVLHFSHALREANLAAHSLANFAFEHQGVSIWKSNFPAWLLSIVEADLT